MTAAGNPPVVDWSKDPYWRHRRFSPAQLLIHDIRFTENPFNADSPSTPFYRMSECLNSTLLPDLENRDYLLKTFKPEVYTTNREERSRFEDYATNYGWMNCLRSKGIQKSIKDPPGYRRCRWIHISSKDVGYLEGVLFALSDWNSHPDAGHAIISTVRQLNSCIQQNERFSKHGRYFSPFFEPLSEAKLGGPMIIATQFLDWTVAGESPALRYQIDPSEGFQSARTSAHPIRSVLQHFYRLEDTKQRESQQVFSKHKPWVTDRSLNLKIKRFYGDYPTALNVDELWILIIDNRHIVTFSSNQSWKSRFPPQQFVSRVEQVSFSGIRRDYLDGVEDADYTAYTHAVACMSGSVGILHRNFWSDIPLCLTDRYVGFLSHLQYRLLRSPSLNLVTELMQVQDELNIILHIIQQQMDLLCQIQSEWDLDGVALISNSRNSHSRPPSVMSSNRAGDRLRPANVPQFGRENRYSFKNFPLMMMADPMKQLIDNLRKEQMDLKEIGENSSNLVTRTIQLVNIRLEDHGKQIMIFTVTTVIFLPLSFVSSYFGMNTTDIRNLTSGQSLFWIYAVPITVVVLAIAVFLATSGTKIWEVYIGWRRKREELRDIAEMAAKNRFIPPVPTALTMNDKQQSFRVIGSRL